MIVCVCVNLNSYNEYELIVCRYLNHWTKLLTYHWVLVISLKLIDWNDWNMFKFDTLTERQSWIPLVVIAGWIIRLYVRNLLTREMFKGWICLNWRSLSFNDFILDFMCVGLIAFCQGKQNTQRYVKKKIIFENKECEKCLK